MSRILEPLLLSYYREYKNIGRLKKIMILQWINDSIRKGHLRFHRFQKNFFMCVRNSDIIVIIVITILITICKGNNSVRGTVYKLLELNLNRYWL